MNGNKIVNFTMILTVLAVGMMVVAATPGAAADRSYAQAPMRIVTEGLNAQEHLERQAELSRRLIDDLPAGASESAIRLALTSEDIAAIDRAVSKVPLRIGIVKAMARGIEVFGLTRGSLDRQPTRGRSAMVVPTRDGGLVWAAVVTTKNAGAIRLHIESMSLPRGAELYFYSRNGEAYGPYVGSGPDGTGEFWTATIFSSEAILQLRAPATVNVGDVSFRVAEAGLISPKFTGGLQSIQAPPPGGWPCGNPNCVLDASCNNASPYNTLKLSEAKIEWVQGAYIYTCSGGLISDNNPSMDNFFLTANHCISKNNTAKNANFYWRFATSSCNGSTCPSNSGWPYQTSGATVSQTGRKGDYSLLHLNSSPPSGSVTLGWTTTPVANTNGLDLYRVSNPNFGPQVYSQHNVDTTAPTCSSWPRGERIYTRDIVGAIDGGSSGSPITNASAQIVGQLSGTCGTNPSDPCSSGTGEANATVDGAFAYYYSSVQPFINP